jgi:stearoyl-CoA desaturase (Delta-9 desaturase)
MQPYDINVKAKESTLVIYWGLGEGYHNYHHVFPYDYSASEFGWEDNWNPATAFIDFFGWIGWAYDRKVAPTDIIKSRSKRCGDKKIYVRYNYMVDILIGFLTTSFFLIFLLPLKKMFL